VVVSYGLSTYRTSDGGGWVVRLTGNSADRQEPYPIRARQDLAPSRRPDPDDVISVQRVPVAIDFYVGRATQRDVDLFLPKLVGRRIPGALRRVIMRRVCGRFRRHVHDRHAERHHAQLDSSSAKREPLQETLDRVELADPLVSDISHANPIVRSRRWPQAAAGTIASTLRRQQS
jgi:hypothetical protein